MFNIYQYERLEQDELRRVNATMANPKKVAKYLSKYIDMCFGFWILKI